MRILFFTRQTGLLRHFDEVLRLIAQEVEELVIAVPERNLSDWLPRPLRELQNVRVAGYREGADPALAKSMRIVRLLGDYLRYLEPPADAASFNRLRVLRRIVTQLSRKTRGIEGWPDPPLRLNDAERSVLKRLVSDLESKVPEDAEVRRFIESHDPTLVLVTPLVSAGSHQVEIVKAAAALGVPSALLVFSWDNLSNKGLIHVAPDRVFLWNDVQRREAVEMHGIAPERIVTTGAPRFDGFFAGSPSVTREQFCGRHGLDPARPIVLYLGSSDNVCPDETAVADLWLEALRGRGGPRAREASVFVRPHPVHVSIWSEWRGARQPGVAVAEKPKKQGDQSLYDQLFHATVVVGLNTSAQIEAAILERPVYTFAAGALAPGQQGSLHFEYLLLERGGTVEYAATLDQHMAQLERGLGGDYDREAIRRFVERFVRPCGLHRPAAPILAQAVLDFARAPRPMRRRRVGVRRWLGRLIAR